MVKTTRSLCVPAEGRTVLSPGSLPGAYFCSLEPDHFGKTRSVGCGVSWWQIQTSSLWLGSYMTVGTESLLFSFLKWRCVCHSVWYTGVLSESVFITINANPFTLKHEKLVRLGGGEHSILQMSICRHIYSSMHAKCIIQPSSQDLQLW